MLVITFADNLKVVMKLALAYFLAIKNKANLPTPAIINNITCELETVDLPPPDI
jgi:hypothetical protein